MATPRQSAGSRSLKVKVPKQSVGLRSRSWAIGLLPGLSAKDQAMLAVCGIQTTQQLLVQTKTVAQRQALAARLQIHLQHVNKWAALADLARVPAIGCQYCGLLLHAGISSPAQLAQMPLSRLHQQILKLHIAMMQNQEGCPGLGEVSQWVEQAKLLGSPI
jgi:predicted flap endonuclease-1-like 5' DNA nuclease